MDELRAALDMLNRHSVFDPEDGNYRVEGGTWEAVRATLAASETDEELCGCTMDAAEPGPCPYCHHREHGSTGCLAASPPPLDATTPDPATGLNKDRVTIRINTFVNGVALGRSTQITVKHDDEVNIDFPINLDTLLRDGLQDGVRVTAINTVPINCECPGCQFNMHLDGCPYREAKPFA